MSKQWKLLTVVVVVVLLAVGVRFFVILNDGGRKGGKKNTPVVAVGVVKLEDLTESFQSVGTVDSPQRVELSPKVAGRVEFLRVRPGDHVRRGEVLVRIDRGQLEDQVNACSAEVAEARARLAQATLSQVSNDTSIATEVRQKQAALATARANLAQVRQSSQADVAKAHAEVDNAKAEADNAHVKLERQEELYRQAFTSAQDVDDGRTQAMVADGKLRAARESLRAAEAAATADVAVAEAELTQAEAAYDHARANTVGTSAYRQNLSALQAVVEAAEASLASAKSRLADTVLASPLDGYVTARNLDEGGYAKVGEAVVVVQSTRELWATVHVPANVRERLSEKSKVTVGIGDSAPLASHILQINAAANPEDKQFEVRVALPPELKARPGVFASVSLCVEEHAQAVAVPRSAVRNDSNKGVAVIVITPDNVADMRKVTTGFSTAQMVQILDGVKPGERVVVLGANRLESGQTVKVDDGSESPEAKDASPGTVGEKKGRGSNGRRGINS